MKNSIKLIAIMNQTWKVSSLLLVLMVGLMIKSSVYAQQIPTQYQLSVTPASGFLKVRPGTKAIHKIIVRNPSNFPVEISASIVDFIPDGKSGAPILLSSSSFPYLEQEEVLQRPRTLNAGSQEVVDIAIQVPEGAPEKEYPLTILVKANAKAQQDNSTALFPTIGANLIVWVSQRSEPSQQITVESLQRPTIVDSFRPFEFEPLVRNLEVMSAVASGSATVKDWRGKVLGTMEIYPDIVLGESTRVLRGAVPAPVVLPDDPSAAYAPRLMPTPFSFSQPFWLGPLTVEFTFIHPGTTGNYTTIHTKKVIALPISLFLILVGIIGVFFLSWWVNKKKKNYSKYLK